jgi:hypothetical protein
MVKREVGAILVALLFVATLGAGVASAKGVTIGGGYDGSVEDVFRTNLWNGSIWDRVAERGEVEAVKEMREARERKIAEAEENYTFEGSRDRTIWPAGYWNIDPRYGRAYTWPNSQKSWDVTYGFEWPEKP